jgi:hypothetical protein
VSRAIRLAGGGGIEVKNCDQHIDPIAEQVRYQICEAELVQAIGRGRGVNRTAETPLQVDILADVVLPVTVDEVVQWGAPSELVEMQARDAMALTAPADMSKAWPTVWKNAEAARNALRKVGAKVRAGGVSTDQAVKSLIDIFLKGNLPLDPSPATFVYRRAAAKVHYAVAFFDPRQQPNPGAWIKEKCGDLAERLHFLWRRGEIEPMAGDGKLAVDDNRVWVLVRETLDQLFNRAAKNPWRKLPAEAEAERYKLSQDYQQHPTYVGTGRPGRFALSKDAMTPHDGSPGGITTPHVDAYSALPLELRMRALGPHGTQGVHEAPDGKSK